MIGVGGILSYEISRVAMVIGDIDMVIAGGVFFTTFLWLEDIGNTIHVLVLSLILVSFKI